MSNTTEAMIRHTLETARFTAAASPCGTGVVTDEGGRVERDGPLAIDIAAGMAITLRTLALHPEKAPAALAALADIGGNRQCEGLIHAALADPSSAWGIAGCLEHAIADCKEIAAASAAPKVTDAAVQLVAEQMLRRYDSQYSSNHLSWRDFADDAREDLEAALPALTMP